MFSYELEDCAFMFCEVCPWHLKPIVLNLWITLNGTGLLVVVLPIFKYGKALHLYLSFSFKFFVIVITEVFHILKFIKFKLLQSKFLLKAGVTA